MKQACIHHDPQISDGLEYLQFGVILSTCEFQTNKFFEARKKKHAILPKSTFFGNHNPLRPHNEKAIS